MWRIILLAGLFMAAGGAAQACIAPEYTPRHLTDQANVILAGSMRSAGPGAWELLVRARLKGKSDEKLAVAIAAKKSDQRAPVESILKDNAGGPVMLFRGDIADGEQRAYLHMGGAWLELEAARAGASEITGFAPQMASTFAGGTDQLIRMTEYVLSDPNADVPIAAGVRWLDRVEVGRVGGSSAGMAIIELGGKPKVHLFVSSTEGDRLFRVERVEGVADKKPVFMDVTRESALDAKSRQFTWLDANGDGLLDLVTWDGAGLTVHFSDQNGKFHSGAAGWSTTLDKCTGLAPCSPGGKPRVLVSTAATPLLLIPEEDGWKALVLPPAAASDKLGTPSPCVVADLDLDGRPDVLQPGENEGRLWRGSGNAARWFEMPVAVNVSTGGGVAKIAVGDFDENGSLDIFLSGPKSSSLWENDGKGGFKNVFARAGSLSYKCPPAATNVAAMDLNHDGRTDLCIVYAEHEILYHFNRGFRTFGEEGEVRLPGLEWKPGEKCIGQIAMAVADLNADNSDDLVVLTATGQVRAYTNDKFDVPQVRLRLPRGAPGPVTVSCWQGEESPVCCGTVVVDAASPPPQVTARRPGKVTLKWTLPGRGEQKKTVTVEDRTLDVLLEGER